MLQVLDAASLLLEKHLLKHTLATSCNFACAASAQEVGDPAGTRDEQVILRSFRLFYDYPSIHQSQSA